MAKVAKQIWLEDKLDLILKNVKNFTVQDGTLLIQKGELVHHVIIVINDNGLLASPTHCYKRGEAFGQESLTKLYTSKHALLAVGKCEVLVVDGRNFRQDLQVHTTSEKATVRNILKMSEQFSHLHFTVQDELGAHLVPCTFQTGESLMVEGETGQEMLFVQSGEMEVTINMGAGNSKKVVARMKAGSVVGEGALFDRQSKRSATVIATTEVRCFRLLYQDFHRIAPKAMEDLRLAFLKTVLTKKGQAKEGKVNAFDGMSSILIAELCRRATTKFYAHGEYIIQEGDPVTQESCLYIVKRGTVAFEKTFNPKDGPKELGQVFGGSVFGEGSLLSRDAPRSASCVASSADGVECALISFENYDQVVTEDVTLALKKDFEARQGQDTFSESQLTDLEILRELGQGGYGSVHLVRHAVTGRVCAVKESNIAHAEAAHQGACIARECALLYDVRHPFIIHIFGNFASSTAVFMAMDPVLGGELLHAILNNFDVVSKSQSVRFYIGQVVDVLSYLHRLHISYRDLKPENLLVGADGYLTLIDFSVAKKTTR